MLKRIWNYAFYDYKSFQFTFRVEYLSVICTWFETFSISNCLSNVVGHILSLLFTYLKTKIQWRARPCHFFYDASIAFPCLSKSLILVSVWYQKQKFYFCTENLFGYVQNFIENIIKHIFSGIFFSHYMALCDYLCLLGWSPNGHCEIMPIEEIIHLLDLCDVNKNNVRFDDKN